jgi:tetratricopeptide (TPR) repeat protein
VNQVGRYELLGELARGGAGVVYRAKDPLGGREVALKVLLRGQGASEHERRRFVRETQAMTKLAHPNLVAPFHVGEHNGLPYLVMELLPGGTLQDRLQTSGPLPPVEAAEIAAQLADALDHAHRQGVIHRDIKPANVLLDAEGRPRLTDFGLAKDLQASLSALSRSGAFMGTPGFWPPEQAQGRLADLGPHSDVYALGATLFALLTGAPPFEADDLVQHMTLTCKQPAPAPSERDPAIPRALDAVCLRCLEKDPAARYPSAAALARVLRRAAEAPHAAPAGKKPAWPLAVAAGLVLAGVGGAALVLRGAGSPAPSPTPTVTVAPSPSPAPSTPVAAEEEDDVFAGVSEAAQALNERAMELAARGAYDEALSLLTQALEPEPTFASGWENRGAVYALMERYDEALADMDRAVALRPDRIATLRQRAVIRANSGDVEGAVAELESVLERLGEDADVFADMARMQANMGRHPDAIATVDRALELGLGPIDRFVFIRLRSHRALKDYQGMLADYDVLLELAPDPGNAAGIHNDRATIYMRTNRPGEAINGFSKAIELGLEKGIVYLNRGQAYGQLGDLEGALLDYERAAELFGPGHQLAGDAQRLLEETRQAQAERDGR